MSRAAWGLTTTAVFLAGLLLGIYGLAPMLQPSPEELMRKLRVFPEDSAWRSESLRIIGSTTVLPIGESCAKEFMKLYNVSIVVEGGGSGRGISGVIDGICDIGMASRPPKPEELELAEEKGVALVLHKIAADGIAVIVHPSVVEGLGGEPLKLTIEDVSKIYSGEYVKWSDLDPRLPDKEIIVFTREPGSGTRDTFEKFVLEPFKRELKSDVSVQPSNPAMRASVEKTPYSIGYVGLGFVTGDVKAVLLAKTEDGPYYEPTAENVKAGVYPISRFLYMVTRGYPESGSLVDRFLDFVKSPRGQSIVEECGFVSIYPTEEE